MLVKQLFVCSAFLADYSTTPRVFAVPACDVASLYKLSARVNDHFEVRVELRTTIEHFGGTNCRLFQWKFPLAFSHTAKAELLFQRCCISHLKYEHTEEMRLIQDFRKKLNDRTLTVSVTVEADQVTSGAIRKE